MASTTTATTTIESTKPAATGWGPTPITLKVSELESTFDGCTFSSLFGTPIIAVYGLFTVPIQFKTFLFSIFYYYLTAFGITGAVEGSIRWWCRDHRAHHRFTDTPKDPLRHIGWMLVKQDKNVIGRVDISDLNRDKMITWQAPELSFVTSLRSWPLVLPSLVAGLGWGDYAGGYFYRRFHHATFCHSPRDHFITALLTLGEGYHNFHHQFPSDYRNAIQWWQYDPTKWSIWVASLFGLTNDLKQFPENEIVKGRVMMQQKKIDEIKKRLDWGVPIETLKVVTFEDVTREIEQTRRPLIIIGDMVYDVTKFMNDHPGGSGFLKSGVGRDMTKAFNGGIYDHSNAARNLMSSMRWAKFEGAVPESFKSKEE
ncbi:hypothetical protein BC829DRAFT_407534 [Chytridium lagenaria]|nr:hypothetical protein BC829DRAFT_407534 [Chytridium lagenaria]